MRAMWLGTVALCLTAICLGQIQGSDQKELTALVDKAVTVMGGAEKLAKLKMITCKSKDTRMIWNKDGKKFADREITEVKAVDSIEQGTFAEP